MSPSDVGTAASYMRTIHHCIFTIKLLTEEEDEQLYQLHFYKVGQRESHPFLKT